MWGEGRRTIVLIENGPFVVHSALQEPHIVGSLIVSLFRACPLLLVSDSGLAWVLLCSHSSRLHVEASPHPVPQLFPWSTPYGFNVLYLLIARCFTSPVTSDCQSLLRDLSLVYGSGNK